MGESAKAQQYERRYPGTGCPEPQKEERMERLSFKEERQTLRRTSRNRGIVVSGDCPWLNQLEKERQSR